MKVKICCISSLEEALLARAHGAHALGLVGPMPSGPGVIDLDSIQEIVARLPADQETFLLTSAIDVQEVVKQQTHARTTTIQLVDELTQGNINELRNALPAVKIVQVVHVLDDSSLDYALARADQADMLLLDSGNPNLTTKELGGTGRTHNWAISRKIVEQSPVPVFLAGGLNAGNVRQAIDTVQPYGVDLCSGVRSQGRLDEKKLEEFFAKIST